MGETEEHQHVPPGIAGGGHAPALMVDELELAADLRPRLLDEPADRAGAQVPEGSECRGQRDETDDENNEGTTGGRAHGCLYGPRPPAVPADCDQ